MDNVLIRIILKVLTDCGYKYQLLPLNEPVDGWHHYQSLGPFRADVDSLYSIARPTIPMLVESLLESDEALNAILHHEGIMDYYNLHYSQHRKADFLKPYLYGKYKEACTRNTNGEYNLGIW